MRDKWLIFGGGPSVYECRERIEKFIAVVDPMIVGTNWLPEWVTPDYHVVSNRNNYKKYRKNLRGIKVGSSKINNLDMYLDVDNEYPAEKGYFKIDDGRIKMAGATVAMYALALAVQECAKTVYFAGLDGFKHKNKTHWYRNEPKWERCMWQQECTKGILRGASYYVDIKILTPTIYKEYYEDIHHYLNG